jgi:glycosyltransferase 2 family protein
MRIARLLVYVFLLAGLLLLGGMVWHVGITALLASFRFVGWWIVPWVLLESVPVVLHTSGWAACFQKSHHRVSFWRLFVVRLSGSAINQVTPTATIGGEVVKVLLLESTLPRAQATAAVVIDKASFTLAQIFHLALGTLYLTGHLPLPVTMRLSLGLTVGLIALGLAGFIAVQRYGLLSKFLGWLSGFNRGRARLDRWRQHLIPLEACLAAYYIAHPWRFVLSLGLHFGAFAFSNIQTFVALRLLLGANAPGLAEAIMVTIAVAALDQMFFFVPGGLGTSEGSRFTILSTLGVAQVYGLAFGLMTRFERLVWNGFGLLAYAGYTRTWRALRRVQPTASASTPAPPTPC